MAMRMMKQRKKDRWTDRLQEIFQEMDKGNRGYIKIEQMAELYRIYKVDFDEEKARRMTDSNGFIGMAEFVQYGLDYKLLDLTNRDISSPTRKEEEEMQQKKRIAKSKTNKESGGGLCSCLGKKKQVDAMQMDRIEAAFRKFDVNGDGYLSWEEFKQVTKDMDQEQAKRIFEKCDKAGDNRISLEEFRATAGGN